MSPSEQPASRTFDGGREDPELPFAGMPGRTFRKAGDNAPFGYFAWEAAGLRWLAAAPSGAAVVPVLEVGEDFLDLERLVPRNPTRAQCEAFGATLARTHAAGAPAYGSPPDDWRGDGWLGPLSDPLPLPLHPVASWGEFLARERLAPMVAAGLRNGIWDERDVATFGRVMARLERGEQDTAEPAARLHGDLWAGNIVWTEQAGVLIDPAAHGGHREADLAFLALFPPPHLDAILGAYHDERPLADGWRDRVSLHQLHPLMLHAVLYGGRYVEHSRAVARRWA
ncbi:fructosamine kinase family protein [Lapillicoccus sp.]|uniref:fructosamine kinase family protein n=1 Tax=Lapillicoccus sp. TaxID=1909287 RepID=UPI00387EB8DA